MNKESQMTCHLINDLVRAHSILPGHPAANTLRRVLFFRAVAERTTAAKVRPRTYARYLRSVSIPYHGTKVETLLGPWMLPCGHDYLCYSAMSLQRVCNESVMSLIVFVPPRSPELKFRCFAYILDFLLSLPPESGDIG